MEHRSRRLKIDLIHRTVDALDPVLDCETRRTNLDQHQPRIVELSRVTELGIELLDDERSNSTLEAAQNLPISVVVSIDKTSGDAEMISTVHADDCLEQIVDRAACKSRSHDLDLCSALDLSQVDIIGDGSSCRQPSDHFAVVEGSQEPVTILAHLGPEVSNWRSNVKRARQDCHII